MNNLPVYFRIGVYGIVCENKKILLAKENIKGKQVVKFPGGGLQLGEGIKDALIREFNEELGMFAEIEKHIYTTDFYVQSAFDSNYQVIAIYYSVNLNERLPNESFEKNDIYFFWKDMSEVSENILTFDTDKKALKEFLIQNKNI